MTVAIASAEARLKKAKHHEIAVRYGRGRPSMAALRVAEYNRELSDRYGSLLIPDDDSGRDDVELMLHHLARRAEDPARRIADWLNKRAPWFTGGERATLVERVLANPMKFKADTLGKRIGLTAERRNRLKIRTIGAIDQTAAQRLAARKAQKREAKRKRRRAQGVRPRAEFEAASRGHGKPWLAVGVSRATWYRRQRRAER